MKKQNTTDNDLEVYIQLMLKTKGLNLGQIVLKNQISEFCTADLKSAKKLGIDKPDSHLVFNLDIIFSAIVRHAKGDYGVILKNKSDYRANSSSRSSGGSFISLYKIGNEYIKVVTSPGTSRTTVCFASEE